MSDLKPDPGVFLVKGDTVSVQSLSLSVNEQGEIESSPLILHVGIDMTGYWLDIAYKHLVATESAHKKLMLAKEERDDEKISRYLKKESIAGMQSIMAAASHWMRIMQVLKSMWIFHSQQLILGGKRVPRDINKSLRFFEWGFV